MLAVAGLGVFVFVALAAAALRGALLDYPTGTAKLWILGIESVLTLSIAAMLVLLFTGRASPAPSGGSPA